MTVGPRSADAGGEERFRGTLRFPGDVTVDAELVVDDGLLVVVLGEEEVGSWPLAACRAARDDGDFRLSIDGEEVGFAPVEPGRFARTAAERFAGSTLADRIGIMRTAPATDEPGDGGRPGDPPSRRVSEPGSTGGWRRPARWAGFVASALLAGALAAALGLGPAGEPPPTLGGETVRSSTTQASPAVDAFALDPEAFALRWNEVADDLGTDLRLVGVAGSGDFERRLSDRVILQGTVGGDGTVDAFVLTVDPAGTGGENLVSLASWGTAVAVASPELDAEGRRRLLAELGFDVDDPRVIGIDGEAERDGVRYTMRYVEGFRTVLFAVEGG